jgi:hypothetical protein
LALLDRQRHKARIAIAAHQQKHRLAPACLGFFNAVTQVLETGNGALTGLNNDVAT